jgi:hypothetical protein
MTAIYFSSLCPYVFYVAKKFFSSFGRQGRHPSRLQSNSVWRFPKTHDRVSLRHAKMLIIFSVLSAPLCENIGFEDKSNDDKENNIGEHIGSPLRDIIRSFKTLSLIYEICSKIFFSYP